MLLITHLDLPSFVIGLVSGLFSGALGLYMLAAVIVASERPRK